MKTIKILAVAVLLLSATSVFAKTSGCDCGTEPKTEPKVSHHSSGGYMPKKAPVVYVYDVVKYGSMGQAVKDFQMLLNNHGAKLVVDGIYGELTQKAWLKYEATIKK